MIKIINIHLHNHILIIHLIIHSNSFEVSFQYSYKIIIYKNILKTCNCKFRTRTITNTHRPHQWTYLSIYPPIGIPITT